LVGAADEFWGYLFELDHGAWAEVAKLKRPDGLYFSRVSLDGAFALALRYVYAIGEPFSLADFAAFQNCYGQAAVLPGCGRFDLEPNDLIDASDLPMFLLTFIGPE
jgi:hypothetical protein